METLQSNFRISPVASSRLAQVDMTNIPFGRVFSDHMLVARCENGKWETPEIVPYGPLPLHPSLMALNYGQSIFEGMKAFRNIHDDVVFFRPEANFQRLNRSAQRMCMPEIPESIFMEGLQHLVRMDQHWTPVADKGSLYIRPLYFASDEFIGVRASESYTFTIFTCPVGAYYPKPVKLLVNKDFIRAAPGGTGAAKTAGNYAGSLYPDRLAKEAGYDNILWLDAREQRWIEECGTMNVFFVIDDTVITPPLTGTILPGITRHSVIRLLKDNNYKLDVRPISIDEVSAAYDEGSLKDVFGAGTAATIAPIDSIGFSGRDMYLPPVDERPVSQWLKSTLSGIRSGELDDPYQWITPLKR